MEPSGKKYHSETAYKRLYWEGFKGRFGTFTWPTETGPLTYNHSEEKAYRSAAGLRDLLGDLHAAYPGNVRVMAHSMGNIVVGEALRLEAQSSAPRQLIHTYVASQAAVAAHAYDRTVEAVEDDDSTDTPEVFGQYPVSGLTYFSDVRSGATADAEHPAVVGTAVNFFNASDFALFSWRQNQDLKPFAPYHYENGTYSRGEFIGEGEWDPHETFEFETDSYLILSHISEARSRALGSQAGVKGPFVNAAGNPLEVNLDAEFEFGDTVAGHSAQFLSNNMARHEYWRKLLDTFGLPEAP